MPTTRIKSLKTIQRGDSSVGASITIRFQSSEMCGDLCDFGGELCGLVGFSGVRCEEIPMLPAKSFEFTFEF
jgi:hypothetical protein